MSNQKKKTNRKYQFDPLSYSSLYPFVSESVRCQIKKDRERLYELNEWRRESRRKLFEMMSEAQMNFVPPQTREENDARALSLNKQIAIKTEIKSSLESLQSLLDFSLYKVSGRDKFYKENLEAIRREEVELRKRIESLRKERKEKFLDRIQIESQEVLESREKQRLELEEERKRTRTQESEEEEVVLFPSDRKLLACGLITPSSKNTTL